METAFYDANSPNGQNVISTANSDTFDSNQNQPNYQGDSLNQDNTNVFSNSFQAPETPVIPQNPSTGSSKKRNARREVYDVINKYPQGINDKAIAEILQMKISQVGTVTRYLAKDGYISRCKAKNYEILREQNFNYPVESKKNKTNNVRN